MAVRAGRLAWHVQPKIAPRAFAAGITLHGRNVVALGQDSNRAQGQKSEQGDQGKIAAGLRQFVHLGYFDFCGRSLHDFGFTEVSLLDRDEINRRYLAGRADGLRVRGLAQIAVARGAEPRTP